MPLCGGQDLDYSTGGRRDPYAPFSMPCEETKGGWRTSVAKLTVVCNIHTYTVLLN